ncbi:hypothetical protein AALA00_13205 [Lachnospiraceae bacterium 46-15]
MGNKMTVIKECNKVNGVRKVCTERIGHKEFFYRVRGHLLMSGCEAVNTELLADMVYGISERGDMPMVVLSSRREFLEHLEERKDIDRMIVSYPGELNYHPMYGMSEQQILRLFRMAGEEMGCGTMTERVMLYAAAVINIVSAKYPASLPAISALLKEDDDFIASFANRMGMSNIIADNILGSHEAGIMLRRIVERLEETFEGVSKPGNDTKYNFQSGAQGNVSVMAFYQISSSQSLLNTYLKEEFYSVLKRVSKLRVILDEAVFLNETDELMTYLLQMKRQGKIEMIAVSENVKEMMPGATLDFGNVCLFRHTNPGATEELSQEIFGTYLYHYPVCVAGRPPAVLFTLKRDIHWQISTEERLKVRAEDLYKPQNLFGRSFDYMAIKTINNERIYLVSVEEFLSPDDVKYYPAFLSRV